MLAQTAAIEDALKAELQQPTSQQRTQSRRRCRRRMPDPARWLTDDMRVYTLIYPAMSVTPPILSGPQCRHLAALEKRGSRSVKGHMPLAPSQQQAGDDMNPGSARNR